MIWAIRKLSGIATPAYAAYSVSELAHQLKSSGAKALFTFTPLLKIALAAAKQADIPNKHVYILQLPSQVIEPNSTPHSVKSVNQLISEGISLPIIPEQTWRKGQGEKQVALLPFSSGTSGPPVGK